MFSFIQSLFITHPRPVWFVLVDNQGNSYMDTKAATVTLYDTAIIDQLKQAVKTLYDSENYLKDVLSVKLQVYRNKAAFNQKESLEGGIPVSGLGSNEEDPLIVAVPPPQCNFKHSLKIVLNLKLGPFGIITRINVTHMLALSELQLAIKTMFDKAISCGPAFIEFRDQQGNSVDDLKIIPQEYFTKDGPSLAIHTTRQFQSIFN